MNPRKLAKEAGEKLYQGSPCKAGGHTARYASSGACVACGKANLKDRYDNDPVFKAKAKAHSHKWYADHVELSTDRSKAYYKAHKDDPGFLERIAATNMRWRNSPHGKEQTAFHNSQPSREKKSERALYKVKSSVAVYTAEKPMFGKHVGEFVRKEHECGGGTV